MKQQLIPKTKLTFTKKYNSSFKKSLDILSFNNEELHFFLKKMENENSFFTYSNPYFDHEAFLNYDQHNETLYDVVMEQIRFNYELIDEEIYEYIIFQLDSNGYFKNKDFLTHPYYSKAQIEQALKQLRTCEPYGCFAFSLQDCLQLQCIQYQHEIAKKAYLCCNYLEEIVSKKITYVCEKTHLTEDEIMQAFQFIQTLNPKPAANYSVQSTFLSCEFSIRVIDKKIEITQLGNDFQLAFDLEDSDNNEALFQYIAKQRNEYQNLMNAIAKRNTTMLMIMQLVCEKQKGFFLYHNPLNTLTLQEIANECNLHISTISRAIQNKSFEFENRYYALRKMFNHSGTNLSEQEIKNEIKALIDNENKTKPLSDEKVKKLLNKKNIQISRRTVQKYREQCGIKNSSLRKETIV